MPKVIKQQVEGLKKLKDLDFQQRLLFLYTHPNIKEVLLSDITTHSVKQIVEQYSLTTEQHEMISQIIGKILTGQSSSDKLQESLVKTLNLAPEIPQEITRQINEKILAPVKEELDQAYREAMTPDFVKSSENSQSAESPPQITEQEFQPTAPSPASIPGPGPTSTPEPQLTQTPAPAERPLSAPAPVIPKPIPEPASAAPQNWQTPQPSAGPPGNLPIANTEPSPDNRNAPWRVPTEAKNAVSNSSLQDIRTLAKQNPQVLDQPITAGPLQEFGTGNSIAPTVRNWLLDYTKVAGAGTHSSLDRGRYLFKSPNAKNLSEAERLFLSRVLESYDEGLPVKIDPTTKLLAIPKYESNPPTQRSDDVRTFKIQPVSFDNIVDLQDL